MRVVSILPSIRKHCILWLQGKACCKLLNESDRFGCTPLHYASKAGNLQTLCNLLDQGAVITLKDHEKSNPLHFACRYVVASRCSNTDFILLLSLLNEVKQVKLRFLSTVCGKCLLWFWQLVSWIHLIVFESSSISFGYTENNLFIKPGITVKGWSHVFPHSYGSYNKKISILAYEMSLL